MRKLLFCLMFLILIESALGAVIRGEVYDLDLNRLTSVVIEVNSTPKQRVISKDGSYSLTLNPGYYRIKANYTDGAIYFAEEQIKVVEDGIYTLDLFLFPSFEEEETLIKDTDIDIEDKYYETTGYTGLILLAFVILTIIFFKFVKKRPEEPEPGLQQIIDLIRKEGGRATQKEIRKKIPLSEAKISLMITELESKGKIRKIKKGRGNILLLNE